MSKMDVNTSRLFGHDLLNTAYNELPTFQKIWDDMDVELKDAIVLRIGNTFKTKISVWQKVNT